jgi:hypothetical protein
MPDIVFVIGVAAASANYRLQTIPDVRLGSSFGRGTRPSELRKITLIYTKNTLLLPPFQSNLGYNIVMGTEKYWGFIS